MTQNIQAGPPKPKVMQFGDYSLSFPELTCAREFQLARDVIVTYCDHYIAELRRREALAVIPEAHV